MKRVYFAGKVNSDGYRQKLFNSDTIMSEGVHETILGSKISQSCVRLIYGGCFSYVGLNLEHGLIISDEVFSSGTYLDHYIDLSAADIDTRADVLDERLVEPKVYNHCENAGGASRDLVRTLSLKGVCLADVIVAFIDSTDCYGTISEIGYASALGKKIILAFDSEELTYSKISDMWFLNKLPGVLNLGSRYILEFQNDLVDLLE